MRKVLLFIGWNAYGDYLSYNGMVRFLMNYFDEVHIKCEEFEQEFIPYLTILYSDVSNRVYFSSTKRMKDMVINENHKKYFALHAGSTKTEFKEFQLKEYLEYENFFNHINFISNYFDIDDEYTQCSLEYIDNSSFFYTELKLNPYIRYNFFHIERDMEEEENLYNLLINTNNISKSEKYDIICEYGQHIIRDEFKKNKIINIHQCTDSPLRLLKVFESADNIHLIDNSHVLLLYYAQISGIANIKNVNIHIYARNRGEYYYKMFMNPKIGDWNILYE